MNEFRSHVYVLAEDDANLQILNGFLTNYAVCARCFKLVLLNGWSKDKPERLKEHLGSYETIGQALAKDCQEGTRTTWNQEFLHHNSGELDRLWSSVRPFLFPSVSNHAWHQLGCTNWAEVRVATFHGKSGIPPRRA